MRQEGLQLISNRAQVEFDDIWLWSYAVFFEQDVLRLLRVRAVGLGEDDD